MIPTDDDIIDGLRAGCRNAPELVKHLYGLDGTGSVREYAEYTNHRSSLSHRLCKLARRGYIVKIGMETDGTTGMRRMAYEAIE